jgi:hypothetical protein
MTLWHFASLLSDLILSPMGQIFLWGSLTISAFLYTLIKWFTCSDEDVNMEWRWIAASVMAFFWMINVSMWFTSAMGWMIGSDLFFLAASVLIFKRTRSQWAHSLAQLYGISLSLDVVYWLVLEQWQYAILANLVYAFQLLMVTGVWKRLRFDNVVAYNR